MPLDADVGGVLLRTNVPYLEVHLIDDTAQLTAAATTALDGATTIVAEGARRDDSATAALPTGSTSRGLNTASSVKSPSRLRTRSPGPRPEDAPYHLRVDLEGVADPFSNRITVGMEVEAERIANDWEFERCIVTAIDRPKGTLTVQFEDGFARKQVPLMAVRPTDPRSAGTLLPLTPCSPFGSARDAGEDSVGIISPGRFHAHLRAASGMQPLMPSHFQDESGLLRLTPEAGARPDARPEYRASWPTPPQRHPRSLTPLDAQLVPRPAPSAACSPTWSSVHASPRRKRLESRGEDAPTSRRERYMAAMLVSKHQPAAWHRGLYALVSARDMRRLAEMEDAARSERMLQSRCMGVYTERAACPLVDPLLPTTLLPRSPPRNGIDPGTSRRRLARGLVRTAHTSQPPPWSAAPQLLNRVQTTGT